MFAPLPPGLVLPPFADVSPPPYGIPVGSVVAFAGAITDTPPTSPPQSTLIEAWGWMLCDGRSLNKDEYPELFAVLGYLYGGSGDSFSVPDYRGYFLRGLNTQDNPGNQDNAFLQGALEDRAAAPGGQANDVGSTQDFALQFHEHIYETAPVVEAAGEGPTASTEPDTPATTGPSRQGPQPPDPPFPSPCEKVMVSTCETRPQNVFVNYIIRYSYTPSVSPYSGV